MLEFALLKDTGQLIHVNEVPNGKGQGYLCPGCSDQLIAKNNGSKMRSHFAHANLEESKSCLMTQLHRVAQDYFFHRNRLNIPEVRIHYDGSILTKPGCEVTVNNARLEAPIGKYFADVILETSIGEIVIEVCVTHECEPEKVSFFRKNRVPSIEFNLSRYKNLDVHSGIRALERNKAPYRWIYEYCREELITSYEIQKSRERERLLEKWKKQAEKTLNKWLVTKTVLLPSLYEKVTYKEDDWCFSEKIQIFTQRNFELDSVALHVETQNCVILKGQKSKRVLWIAFLFCEEIPEEVQALDGSVIIRIPSVDSGSTWQWLKFPGLQTKRRNEIERFELHCQRKIQRDRATRYYEQKAKNCALSYVAREDLYFRKDYQLWKKWLIERGLFKRLNGKPNPSIPRIFKQGFDYKSVWVFDRWHIYTLSVLAELVDEAPLNSYISYEYLFDELAHQIGLSKYFRDLQFNSHPFRDGMDNDSQGLFLSSRIIKAALTPFELDSKVDLYGYEMWRKGCLLDSIKEPL